MVRLFGIVNVTADSFSDGGRWLEPAAAIARAEQLLADGADVIDVGAESTSAEAAAVPAELEIERLTPVVEALLARGAEVSVDTVKPAVMRAMTALGVHWINDVAGMRQPESIAAVAASTARVVVMFSRSRGPRAERRPGDAATVVAEATLFLRDRVAALAAAGVDPGRVVLDPGMGLFLGAGAANSIAVLRALPRLRDLGLPLLVSVSRKGFLGELTGRRAADRGAATLAAEIYALLHGADCVRTHEVGPLRDAARVIAALQPHPGGAGAPPVC